MKFQRTLRKRVKFVIFTILLIVLIAFVVLLILSLNRNLNSALTYLNTERKNITIKGTPVYNKISNEGCGIVQAGQVLNFMCDVRLDVYYKGTGNYIEEYHDLEKGFNAAGYNIYSGGMFVDDDTLTYEYERHSITLGNINLSMPTEGLTKFKGDPNDPTIWLTPLFDGNGVDSDTTTAGR